MPYKNDYLIWTRDKPNITLHLRQREHGLGCVPPYKRNCRIWRTLICDDHCVYKKAWSVSSKRMIHFLGDKLYLNDFKTCYSLNGPQASPTVLYKNPDKSHTYKLEAYLHCSADLPSLPLPNSEHRPYVLALTKCQNIIRIDLQTGHILQKIFLGNPGGKSFKYLTWDAFQHRAVVSSTQSKLSSELKSFILISVFPLEVVGQLTVSPQVFGSDICDTNITDGLLVVMHRNDKVRMYNLDKILEQNKQFPLLFGEVNAETTIHSGEAVSYSCGIHYNILVTDCPPAIFEVTCLNREVSFGGHPWHYMYIPAATDPLVGPDDETDNETYLVASVESSKLVESGILEMTGLTEDPTMAFFHMDESQRIVQLSDLEMIVNRFHTRDDGKTELRMSYRVTPPSMMRPLQSEDSDKEEDTCSEDDCNVFGWETTWSGRRVNNQWRNRLKLRNKIKDVNFDMELDFLLVSHATTMSEGYTPYVSSGQLGIHCNQTGRLLKRVKFDAMGFEHRPTTVEMDMDFMIHIFVDGPGEMTCNLYRLERPTDYAGKDKATQLYTQRYQPCMSRRSCCN